MKPRENEKKKKNRQRKTIWFNPPFSKIMKTNIGLKISTLINHHFLTHNKMSKTFKETKNL